MKIVIYSGRNVLGTAEATGERGAIGYAGPRAEQVRELVDWYARTTGLRGMPLLTYILLRVRGMGAWAGIVTD